MYGEVQRWKSVICGRSDSCARLIKFLQPLYMSRLRVFDRAKTVCKDSAERRSCQ